MLTHHKALHQYDLKGLDEANVADICCGSGAMGFEALSRGAAKISFVDINGEVLKAAQASAQYMKVQDQCTFLRADAKNLPPARMQYDIIFLDPPYREGMLPFVMKELDAKGWASAKTLICIECSAKEALTIPDTYHILDERVYGSAKILLVLKHPH